MILAVSDASEAYREFLSNLTTTANQKLAEKIDGIQEEFPFLRICLISLQETAKEVLESGKLRNEIFDHQRNSTMPDDNYEYAWFDEFHPTTVVHKFLAEAAQESLKLCQNNIKTNAFLV